MTSTASVAARRSRPEPSGSPAMAPTGSQQITGQLSHRQILRVMAGLLAALFTAMLSTTIVSTALPTIMADLRAPSVS